MISPARSPSLRGEGRRKPGYPRGPVARCGSCQFAFHFLFRTSHTWATASVGYRVVIRCRKFAKACALPQPRRHAAAGRRRQAHEVLREYRPGEACASRLERHAATGRIRPRRDRTPTKTGSPASRSFRDRGLSALLRRFDDALRAAAARRNRAWICLEVHSWPSHP
jgi:hypothetical protein